MPFHGRDAGSQSLASRSNPVLTGFFEAPPQGKGAELSSIVVLSEVHGFMKVCLIWSITTFISSDVRMVFHGIMAVPGLPFVTEATICSLERVFMTIGLVKFLGGGLRTFATNVFPFPLSPWQTLQFSL